MGSWTPAAIIAGCALVFTVASFWLIHMRRGKLKSFEPHTFAAAISRNPDQFRIRFPFVFHNSGAVPIVIQNLRIRFLDESGAELPPWVATMSYIKPEEKSGAEPLPWVATRSHIKPEADDGHAFPAVFSVAGRTASQTFQEFGASGVSSPGFILGAKDYRVRLEAKLGHKDDWHPILTFTLQAWRISAPENFITYDNTPGSISEDDRQEVQLGLEFAQLGSTRPRSRSGSAA